MNEQITLEQQVVVDYLIELKVPYKVDGDAVRFKPSGAGSYGGYVFTTGNVFIHNEHYAPFRKKSVSFLSIAKELKGEPWVKGYRASHPRIPTRQKVCVDMYHEVGLSEQLGAPPLSIRLCQSYKARNAVVDTSFETLIAWIRSPDDAWMGKKATLSPAKLKAATPCVVQSFGDERLTFLDIDKKENAGVDMDALRKRMEADDRIICIFSTISGTGLACGVVVRGADGTDAQVAVASYILNEFERDYPDVHFDKTMKNKGQLRALAYDPNVCVKDKARWYMVKETAREVKSGVLATPNSLLDSMGMLTKQISGEMVATTVGNTDFADVSSGLSDELRILYEMVGANVEEDAWTGRRTYTLGGKRVKDSTEIYIAMLDLANRRNGNYYSLNKTTLTDYIITRVVQRDIVMETVMAGEWDGVKRWSKLKGALHLDDFSLHMVRLWMRQGVKLLYNTGEPTDTQRNFMLILYSRAQHIGKTTLARKFACGTNSFTQKGLNLQSKDTMIDLYSHWIYEYGELGTTFRKSDVNQIKNFVSDTTMSFRRPYDREATVFPVRTSIIGTTNEDDLFVDTTGNRRYLIVDCNWTRDDWDAINEIDFVQLWREAREEVNAGLPYTLTLDEQKENDLRCSKKRCQTKEVGIIMSILRNAESSNGLVNGVRMWAEIDGAIWIAVENLMLEVQNTWRMDIKMSQFIRALETIGFVRHRATLRDRYCMDADVLRALLADYSVDRVDRR